MVLCVTITPLIYIDPSGEISIETSWWEVSITLTKQETDGLIAACAVGPEQPG